MAAASHIHIFISVHVRAASVVVGEAEQAWCKRFLLPVQLLPSYEFLPLAVSPPVAASGEDESRVKRARRRDQKVKTRQKRKVEVTRTLKKEMKIENRLTFEDFFFQV